jgi:hypothetical protein
MRLRRHRRLNRCFEKFEPRMEERGRLTRARLDGVPVLLCRLDHLLDEVFSEFARTPEATLAPDGAATRLSA